MTTLNNIFMEIEKAQNIVLLVHENPDGDAIGSGLAMLHALKNLGKDVELIVPKCPRVFSEMPGIQELKEKGEREIYDLAISMDCATIKLLNGWAEYFENAKSKIVIDHHSTNTRYGDFNYVDMAAPACCQIMYTIFRQFNWEIDSNIANCLMAGIITDTGGFQYSKTSKETFLIAADLMEKGANISKIYKKVLATRSKSSFDLRRIAIDRLELLENEKVSFTYITKEDEELVNAELGDYEGIVNEGRDIEGVEVSIFLHEIDEGFKASLRSNEYVNVSDVCMVYGGGGHTSAAGVKMQGKPEEIKELLLKEVKKQLR